MPTYSASQRKDLSRLYIEAAIELVVRGGWQALGIRAVGQAVGKTGTAINRLFSEESLSQRLVEEAFIFILVALPSDREHRRDRDGVYTQLSEHLLADRKYAALMVQVAAQASLISPAAAPLAAKIREVRQKVVRVLASHEPALLHDTCHEWRIAEAERIISGYIRGCWMITSDPANTAAELRATMDE